MRIDELVVGRTYVVSSGQQFRLLAVDRSDNLVTVEALTRPAGQGSARRPRIGEVRSVTGRQWASSVVREA